MEITIEGCRELIGQLSRLEVAVMEGEDNAVFVDGMPIHFFLRFGNCITFTRPIVAVDETPDEADKLARLFKYAIAQNSEHFVEDGLSFASPPNDNSVFIQQTVRFLDGAEFVAKFEQFVETAAKYEERFGEFLEGGADDDRPLLSLDDFISSDDIVEERQPSELEMMSMRI